MASSSECVKVMVRCRPMNGMEKQKGKSVLNIACVKIVDVDYKLNQITIKRPDSKETKNFTYDAVYDDDSTQQQVYDDSAFSLVESVLEGYNGKTRMMLRYYFCLWSDRMWKDSHNDGNTRHRRHKGNHSKSVQTHIWFHRLGTCWEKVLGLMFLLRDLQ